MSLPEDSLTEHSDSGLGVRQAALDGLRVPGSAASAFWPIQRGSAAYYIGPCETPITVDFALMASAAHEDKWASVHI